MSYDFDSSTPLSIKNLNIRRPIKPLTPRSSYRSNINTSQPLKSILKKTNSYNKDNIQYDELRDKPSRDYLAPLRGISSKLFQMNDSKDEIPKIPEIKNDDLLIQRQQRIIEDSQNRIKFLEDKVNILETENLEFLKANKSQLLKKEMEKQDLEIQNQLLRREIESFKKLQRETTETEHSNMINNYKSKLSQFDNTDKFNQLNDIYKDNNDMTELRRKIQTRKLQKLQKEESNDELKDKISQMEKRIQSITTRLQDNEQPNDLNVIRQIKNIINDDSMRKRRYDIDESSNYKRPRTNQSEAEQLSPIRF